MPNLLSMDFQPAAQRFQVNMRAFRTLVETLADNAVRQTLQDAGRLMDATAPVDTGALRASRTREVSQRRLTWTTAYTVPYAPVLEYGGYPGVGPKTVRLGGGDLGAGFQAGAGIYSKQAPLGWVRKALAQVRDPFRARIEAAVRQAWTGQVGGSGAAEPLPALGSGGLSELFGVEFVE